MKFFRKEILVFVGLMILFLLLRVPAIHHPYHQDEYKWPIIVNPALTEPGGIPHPPLGEAIYRTTFNLFGSDNFRITPLLFGFANLILLYFIVCRRYSIRSAQWSALFFTLSYYSVLASLMVDTDGQILPFFFLLSLWFYDSFNSVQQNSEKAPQNKKKWLWLCLFLVSISAGMLVKMSFVLAIGAFVLDFLFEKNIFEDKRKIVKAFGFGILGVLFFIAVLYLSKFIFPFFRLESSLKYWEGFAKGFGSRNFFQTGIQFVKATFYLSPLLVFGGLFSLRPYRKDLKLFHIFIGLGLIFYLVLFDFSGGALDRYFQFLVVPLCIIGGVIFAKYFDGNPTPPPPQRGGAERGYVTTLLLKQKFSGIILAVITILIFFTQFINQYVPPLYPKTEWISRFLSLKWNFLFPFTGGSGPLGFYVSFLFIALSFIFALAFFLLSYFKKEHKDIFILGILFIGLVYNLSFAEEYLFGKINGSAPTLVKEAAKFIKNNPNIKKVTVYNDNGGYEIQQTGKYRKRLYTNPSFGSDQKIATLNQYKEHYLEINVPPIDPKSFYRKYLDSCLKIYEQKSGYINANIYDCRKAPNIKIIALQTF